MQIRDQKGLKNTIETVVVLALDMDGTMVPIKDSIVDLPKDMNFSTYFFDHPTKETMYEWFVNYHQSTFDSLIKKITETGCSILIITTFTKRSSFEYDRLNYLAHHSMSLVYVLLMTQAYLQSLLPHVKVLIDHLMMPDIASNRINGGKKKSGDSFNLIVKDVIEKEEVPTTHHSKSFPDSDKSLWAYVLTHRLASLYPNALLSLFILDDEVEILRAIKKAVKVYHPDLFPESVPIHLMQFLAFTKTIKNFDLVQGKGETDPLYDWSARFMFFNYLRINRNFSEFNVILSESKFTNAEKIDYMKKLHTMENFYSFCENEEFFSNSYNDKTSCFYFLPCLELQKFRDIMKEFNLSNTLGPPVYPELSNIISEKNIEKIGIKAPKKNHRTILLAAGALGAISLYSLPLAALFFTTGLGITKGLPILKEKCQRKLAKPSYS